MRGEVSEVTSTELFEEDSKSKRREISGWEAGGVAMC